MARRSIPKRLYTQIVKAATQAKFVDITDHPTYHQACECLAYVQLKRRELTDHYKQIKDALNASRRTVLDMEKTHLGRLEPAEARLTELILTYEDTAKEAEFTEEALALVPPEGQYNRETEQVVVNDLRALAFAVLDDRLPLEVLKPNMTALNKLRKQYGGLFRVPGCHVDTRTTVITR